MGEGTGAGDGELGGELGVELQPPEGQVVRVVLLDVTQIGAEARVGVDPIKPGEARGRWIGKPIRLLRVHHRRGDEYGKQDEQRISRGHGFRGEVETVATLAQPVSATRAARRANRPLRGGLWRSTFL